MENMTELKVVAFIPARGGSKSIPKKNLYPVAGKPLIQYVIEAAKESFVDEIWISTDDDEILNFGISMGVNVLPRPDELAQDGSSTEDAMLHFADNVSFDIIVMIQPTSPLLEANDIDRGLTIFMNNNYDSVISAVDCEDILIWSKIYGEPINYNRYNRGIRQTRHNDYLIETGGFYITSKENLVNTKCRCSGKTGFCYMGMKKMFEVDTYDDVKIIESLLTN